MFINHQVKAPSFSADFSKFQVHGSHFVRVTSSTLGSSSSGTTFSRQRLCSRKKSGVVNSSQPFIFLEKTAQLSQLESCSYLFLEKNSPTTSPSLLNSGDENWEFPLQLMMLIGGQKLRDTFVTPNSKLS